ncbi:calymmin [Trichomycterus rosablanca]|uniref:calymmin n=1 Tax=Trichomycterus rosablanca TaxID=2290929 RepID=UPI002F352D55
MGFGSEGKPQVRYGIGGLHFGSSPTGYNSDPYAQYGNLYPAQPYYGPKTGNYNPKPLGLNVDPRSAGKYGMGGFPYGGQPLGPGSETKTSGKYDQPAVPYVPEPVSLGGDAKSASKYGNPALPFQPQTDGQIVNQPVQPYKALPSSPAIDGVNQFGEGKVPTQSFSPLVNGAGEESSGPVSYVKGGVQAEAISYPSAPTAEPSLIPLQSLGNPALSPLAAYPRAATPQQIQVQHQLQVQLQPQTKSWTGGNEGQHSLKGFFAKGYQG